MKKFALLLVTATLVLSCGNRKTGLLFDVRESDFVNKAETTVQGAVVNAEWPLGIRDIIVCDSFLVVNTEGKGASMYVYSDDCEFLGRFCFIGRAKNEFFRFADIKCEQTFKDADGNTLIPLIDHDYGVKLMNLQESVKNHNTTIVTENRYTDSRIVSVFKDGDDGYGVISAKYDFLFLDDDINHTFEEYLFRDFNGTVYVYPHYAVMHDTVQVKEIWLFDKSDKNYSENLTGGLYKHPKRNLIIKPLLDMDYILFFDLDNDTTFAIHQSGSRSFKDGIPPLVVKTVPNLLGYDDIVAEYVPHFGDVAFAESFFMVLYYATDYDVNKPDGGKDSCELMFFDWDGNFLKSVELDHFVSGISYDERKQILYAYEYTTGCVLRYDLSK